MGNWLEFLKGLRLADIKNITVGQGGLINITYENHVYNYYVSDPEQTRKIQELNLTPELEKKAKEDVLKKLAPIEDKLNALPENLMKDAVISTSISSAANVQLTETWKAEYAKEIAGEADIMTGVTQVKTPHIRGKYGVVPSSLHGKGSDGEAATNINLVRNGVKPSFSYKKDSNGEEG
jgi:hypothetical protein